MPEGPSIVLVKEAIKFLSGRNVEEASGTTQKVDCGRLHGAKLVSIKTWGKHLLLCFAQFTVKVHFLMFGSYAIDVPKPKRIIKLGLQFDNGRSLYFYACSITTLEGPVNKHYDWTGDVLNSKWNSSGALLKLKKHPSTLICDALLDQNIFAGVGNIIKNEVLFRTKIHPESSIGKIPLLKRNVIIEECIKYSKEFLEWKREGTLKKHWEAYTRKKCPRDNNDLQKKYLGITKRRTFYCKVCQKLYR
ncbi:MAG: DNA-formamidopyrimidine glycosylase family protein [Chryseolinea sp.]